VVSLRGIVVNGPDKEDDFYTVAPSILTVSYIIILCDTCQAFGWGFKNWASQTFYSTKGATLMVGYLGKI